MVTEIAKITNNFEIVQNLAGGFEVPNLQMYIDTFQAYADNIDEVLIVTSDENSVNGAKSTKKEFKELENKIDERFVEFMEQIKPVTDARLDLKRIMKRAGENIDKKIKEAYRTWIDEAIFEYQRLASFDVTFEMLDEKAFARKQTKKSIYEAVEKEITRLEEEHAKREEERETIEKYCKKAGQPIEPFTTLIGKQELNEILKMIDTAEEREKERVRLEEENRQKQAQELEELKSNREIIENEIVPNLAPTMSEGTWTENTAERKVLWQIELWLSEEEKDALKKYLKENNIKVEGVSRY
jgi:hypothetical protein|nr:MAG TPA: Protein of unknown function (DUF1351) [Caudoviricetes sp.]